MHAAVHQAAGSLLLLPGAFTPRHGPIVAVLTDAEDPALALASHAALNTKAGLLILSPASDPATLAALQARAVSLGVPPAHVSARTVGGLQVEDVQHALGHVHERLVALTRYASVAADMPGAMRLAADRGVPVLLVEPLADKG
jgi:hypothetical protein